MALLKQIDDRGAVMAWSPKLEYPNLVALGTKVESGMQSFTLILIWFIQDSAGTGFDDHGGELELHLLDFADATQMGTTVLGSVRARYLPAKNFILFLQFTFCSSRFSSIAWSQMTNFTETYSMGLIAGGMIDGTVNIWNPSHIEAGVDPLLASLEQHQGAATALHFNPHKESSHLLATGGSDGEVFIMALDQLDPPTVFLPAPNTSKHTADITQVAWNTQVAHILASSAQNGSCFVWDLRQKRAW
jgi:protein transport protein SEC31